MRRLSFTLLFIAISVSAMAQLTDMLFLKTEEVVRGVIVDTTSTEGVSILVLPDSILTVYPHSEILRIIYKKPDSGKDRMKSNDIYCGIFRLGYSWAKNSNDGVSGDFLRGDFINGFSIEDIASIGLGIGARAGVDDQILVPIYLDFRLAPLRGKVSPMFAVSGGLNFQADRSWEMTGMYFSPEIGIRIGNASTSHIIIAFGLEKFSYSVEKNGGFIFTNVREVDHWSWTTGIMIGF